MIGIVGVCGVRSANSERICGLQWVHGRVVRGHFDVDPAGEAVLRAHRGDQRVDLLRWVRRSRSGAASYRSPTSPPGSRRSTPRWRRRRVPAAPCAPCPDSGAISRERVAITRKPSAGVSAPATTAAVTSPIECPITSVGVHPVGAPQLGQRQLHADQPRLDLFDADQFLAAGDHVMQRESDLLNEHRLQFGDRRGERRFVGQQLAAHAGPLRTVPGVDEHRARPAGRLPAGPPRRGPAGRRPVRATRPPPGRVRGRPRWRTWRAGRGDG